MQDSPKTQMCYCNHSYHREWTRTPSLWSAYHNM